MSSIVRIIASSGTTGRPKAIGLTSALVERSVELMAAAGALGESPFISTIGLAAGLGYRMCLGHLMLGSTQILPSAHLDAVTAIRAFNVRFLVASPAQLQTLLEIAEHSSLQFPSLRQIRVAGASVSPQVVLRSRAQLCANVSGAYGATEVGMIAESPAALL